MGAALPDFDPHPPLDKSALSAQLRPVLEMLATARSMTSLEDVADRAGIPRSTFYDRLKKGNFTAVDFVNIARALSVAVDTLYLTPEELLRTGSFAPLLSCVDGLPGQGTLLDDDLRPFDFGSRGVLAAVPS